MPDLIKTSLGVFTAPGIGFAIQGQAGTHQATVTVQGAASVAASVTIRGSNDQLAWTDIGTASPSGTGVATATVGWSNDYLFWRADVASMTGERLQVSVASDQTGGGSSPGGPGSVAVNPATGRIDDAVQRAAVAEAASSLAGSAVILAVGAYGITASGDQSDAIQAAVDYAGAMRRPVVFAGSFQIAKPIFMRAAYPGARWYSTRKHAWYAGDLVQTTNGQPVIVMQANFVGLDGLTLGYSAPQSAGTATDRVAALTAGVANPGYGGVYGASFERLGFYNCDRSIGHSLISANSATKFPWWGNSYRDIWVHESCRGSALAIGSDAGQVNNVVHGYFYIRSDVMTEAPVKIANGSLTIDGLEINNIRNVPLLSGNNAEINIGYLRYESPNLDLTGGSNYTSGGIGLLDFAGTRCNIGYLEIQSLRLGHSSGVVSIFRTNGNGAGSVYCRIVEMAGVTRTGSQFLMLLDVNAANSSDIYYDIGDLVTRDGAGPIPGGWFAIRDVSTRPSHEYLSLGYLDRLRAKQVNVTTGQSSLSTAPLDPLTTVLSGDIGSNLAISAPASPTINQRRTFVRSVAGAGAIDVFGVATMPAGATGSVTVQHIGSGWARVG